MDGDECEVLKDWVKSRARLQNNWLSICEKYERLSEVFPSTDDDDESTSFEIVPFKHTNDSQIASTIMEGVVDRDFGINNELETLISDDDSDTDIENDDESDDESEYPQENYHPENEINEDVFSVVSCATSCCEKSFIDCVSLVGQCKNKSAEAFNIKSCVVAVEPLTLSFVQQTVSNIASEGNRQPSNVCRDFSFQQPTKKRKSEDIEIRPTKKPLSSIETNVITFKVPKSILEVLNTRRVDDILSGFLQYERRFMKANDEDKPSDRLRPLIERDLQAEKYKILNELCPLRHFQRLYKNSPSITEFDDFNIDADLVKR